MKVVCNRTIRGKSTNRLLFLKGNVYEFISDVNVHNNKYAGYIMRDHQGNKRWLTNKAYNNIFERVIWR